MEIKKYLALLKQWLWLLILGSIIGAGVAYAVSIRQVKIYRSTTRVQVISAPGGNFNSYAYFNDQQLAKTYIQTLKSRPILDGVEKKLGVPVNGGQIQTRSINETQLIDISVTDTDPQRAADIANTLVEVFSVINNEQQAQRYIESEISLQGQIASVEEQIKTLQSQTSQETEEYLRKAKDEISRLEAEILTVQGEINQLTNRPRESGFWSTPTPSPEQNFQIQEKQLRMEQLQNTYDLYQEIYTNLTVLGGNATTGNTYTSELQSTLALYEQIRSSLLASYESVRLSRLNSTSNIVQIEPATASSSPIRPQTTTNTLTGLFVGLILALGIVLVKEFFDDRIKSAEQITKETGIPVIGSIAEMEFTGEKPYTLINPRSPISESFRSLRTNLEFLGVDKPLKTLLVVSANPEEGKSTISANLASSISQGEKKVLLVDADLRRPRIHKLFNLPNRNGLSDLIINSTPIHEALHIYGGTNLAIITSGGIPPNPADLLSSARLKKLLEDFKNEMDFIVVDAPPFLVADAAILAASMDAVVLVVYQGRTKMDALKKTLEQMKHVGANVVGVVMNHAPVNKTYYSKSSYYSSYYQDDHMMGYNNGKKGKSKQADAQTQGRIGSGLPASGESQKSIEARE